MIFLMANWRWIAIVLLLVTNAGTFKLWRGAVQDLTDYQARVEAIGEQAKKDADRINAEHAQTLKEIKDAIPKKIAAARTGAIDAYRLRYPGGGDVSCPAIGPGGTDAAGKESVAPGWSGTDPAFVQDCSQDAATIGLWQAWATKNKIPVE